MAEYFIKDTTLTSLADSIRAKTGKTNTMTPESMASEINSLDVGSGVDTSSATAEAGDILSGETAYVKGSKITGTIPTKTSEDLTVNGATVTIPNGYYANDITKSVDIVSPATPTIDVSSSGLITASSTQSAGYVTAGTKSATKQLTTQAAKTITPTTTSQTAVASGRYTTGAVTVAGDANLKAENIAEGVSIFGISGTHSGGSDGVDTSDATATADDILLGETAYVNGEKITGTMPNNNEINYSIDGINTQSVDIPTGYTSGGKVSLTDDIENMLAAI